jgi:hypothetical protein
LPCPEGVIAELDEEFLKASNIGKIFGKEISPGLHFGTSQIGNVYRKPPRALINQAGNRHIFPGIILFDILTLNNNRNNDGNYLIVQAEQNSFEFNIIDHGHCFGSPNWDVSIARKVGTWNWNILPEMANSIQGSDPFRSDIEKIGTLSNEFIRAIVSEIPDEWSVTVGEREALQVFLIGQRDKIEEIISNNKNRFPYWT